MNNKSDYILFFISPLNPLLFVECPSVLCVSLPAMKRLIGQISSSSIFHLHSFAISATSFLQSFRFFAFCLISLHHNPIFSCYIISPTIFWSFSFSLSYWLIVKCLFGYVVPMFVQCVCSINCYALVLFLDLFFLLILCAIDS